MTTTLPWKRVLFVPGVLGALVGFVVQRVPSYNILAHEFTMVFCLVGAAVIYGIGGTIYRSLHPAPGDEACDERLPLALYGVMLAIFSLTVATLGVMYGFNAFVHGCNFGKGMPFFLATWIPLALLMAVLGLWTAARGWGWFRRPLFFGVLIVASLGHDFLQVTRGLRMVDPLIGLPLGFDQRIGMITPNIHLYQRVGVLLIVGALWCTLLWRHRRSHQSAAARPLRRWVVLSWALAALYVGGAGSFAGLGLGYGKIRGTLSERVVTEHFEFRYAPGGSAARNIAQTIPFAEWTWSRLTTLMEIEPSEPVTLYLTENSAMQMELSGMRAANAMPGRIMLTDHGVRTPTLLHELVHALDARETRHRLNAWQRLGAQLDRFSTIFTLEAIFYRGRSEGIAQAYGMEYAMTPDAHRNQAAALAHGALPPAKLFMGFDGFRKVNENNAYNLAGSFMGYLIQEYGIDAMKVFLDSHHDYEWAFGKDIDALDAGWRAFLQQIPVKTEEVLSVGRSYDSAVSRSFTAQCCPKLGSRVPIDSDPAYTAFNQGRYEEALSAYEARFQETGDPKQRVQQVNVYRAMGDFVGALGVVEGLLSEDTVSSSQRLEYNRLKELCLLEQRDWAALYALHAQWPEIEPDANADTLRIQRLIQVPAYRERIATLVLDRDGQKKREAVASLAEEAPDDPDIDYLQIVHVYLNLWPPRSQSGISPDMREELMGMVARIRRRPSLADGLGRNVERFIDHAIGVRDFELADTLVALLEGYSNDPLRVHRMGVLRERIIFERAYVAALR